jgi:hypothetical protein
VAKPARKVTRTKIESLRKNKSTSSWAKLALKNFIAMLGYIILIKESTFRIRANASLKSLMLRFLYYSKNILPFLTGLNMVDFCLSEKFLTLIKTGGFHVYYRCCSGQRNS